MNIQSNQTLTLRQALGRAVVAEKCYLARVHAEIQELRREGVYVPLDAIELCLLERNGFVYDFDSGQVLEATT